MKRIIDKYLGWLKDSNRPKHILCGLLVYAAMMAVCSSYGVAAGNDHFFGGADLYILK